MRYFVTGASGFIGKRLVAALLQRDGAVVYFLVRPQSLASVPALRDRWKIAAERAIAITGDVTQSNLGVSDTDRDGQRGKIDHFFHLAALYDLKADAQAQQQANVEGTRHAVQFAHDIGAGCFHLTSSIAAAGLYEGIFRENMFEEAENLEHPYFRTKHDAEAIVRRECKLPWRIYRPGIVVGDSRTGEMDKIDGPYYFFKLIQKLRRILPPWMPAIGIEGGRLNLVPVDFVVKAMDYLAHQPGLDSRCFHLIDPSPLRVGELLNIFARAGHAPEMTIRLNTRMLSFIPASIRKGLALFTPLQRIKQQIMTDLALPPDIMKFVNYPTRFDNRETLKLLKTAHIEVPRLKSYAWRLWDYWERNLDPDLFVDRSLKGTVQDKVVLITGAAAGIGKATALKLVSAGATVLVVDRDEVALAQTKTELQEQGGTVHTYVSDLTDFEATDRLIKTLLERHGQIDILINNAGRSIRRAIEHSFDRFHDFERLMKLNYFGALRLTLGVLRGMQARKRGHIINVSSIGVLANAPRFSAYVASKAAMDAFARCAASEFADDGIAFTTINMPLVNTAMSAPTRAYQHTPMLTPEEAAELLVKAIIEKPERVTTRLGVLADVTHAVAPKMAHVIMNTAYRMFPESSAAAGPSPGEEAQPTANQVAFAELMQGFHL